MAWNQMRPSVEQLLNKIPNWQARGLTYWQDRVWKCNLRVAAADSSTQLGRALSDREIAHEAIRRLETKQPPQGV
jgi:hypothetical protein